MTAKRCMGYCEDGYAQWEDPKSPPLDFGPCLCTECAIGRADEAIEETEQELDRLETLKAKLEDSL